MPIFRLTLSQKDDDDDDEGDDQADGNHTKYLSPSLPLFRIFSLTLPVFLFLPPFPCSHTAATASHSPQRAELAKATAATPAPAAADASSVATKALLPSFLPSFILVFLAHSPY